MNWKPNKYIAALLGFIFAPIGMLYLNQKSWATVYLLIIATFLIARFTILSSYSNEQLVWFQFIILAGVIHCFVLAKQQVNRRPWFSRWYGILMAILLILLPLLITKTFFYELFRVPSSSMEPTLNTYDHIVIKKWGCGNYRAFNFSVYQTELSDKCKILPGDVIAFQYPKNPDAIYLKRVLAIGGDQVKYQNKSLFVNGNILENEIKKIGDKYTIIKESLSERSYQIQHRDLPQSSQFKYTELVVPDNSYYVLGDNRDESADSRLWGVVHKKYIIGKLHHIIK